MVIAIDVGTTFSGYAFSTKDKESDIYMFKEWGKVVNIPATYKTPTCVMTNKMGEFEAFGYEAQHRYSHLLEEGGQYDLFEHFKMKLHTKVSIFGICNIQT